MFWLALDEYNIIISGVGGLGILTMARIIAETALIEEKNVTMSEIHGLSQRYGMVVTHVRIGSDVMGPLVKEGFADLLIGLEPVEALRHIEMIKDDGYVILNLNMIPPPTVTLGIDIYPRLEDILNALSKKTSKIVKINALEKAEELGNPLLQNTILLGIALSLPNFPLSPENCEKAIEKVFAGREDVINLNKKALREGMSIAKTLLANL